MNIEEYEKVARMNKRSGACEDDVEVTAPYLTHCPEESSNDSGLDFGMNKHRAEDRRTFAEWCLKHG